MASMTVSTVAVVFLVLGVFALIGHNLGMLADRLSRGLRLSVYIEDNSTSEQREEIHSRLNSCSFIQSVQFVDANQARLRFREQFGSDASVLDGLGENLLPESFEVTFTPGEQHSHLIENLARELARLDGVEDVQYGRSWRGKFMKLMKTVRLLGAGVGFLLCLAALFVISNTIRLSIYARQEEIEILKLVGASDSFVKVPFYLEGITIGALGAGLGLVLTWLLFVGVMPGLLAVSDLGRGGPEIIFLPTIVVLVMTFGGALLGFLGTMTSLWRHLKT